MPTSLPRPHPSVRPLLVVLAAYQRLLSPDHSWLKVFFPRGVCRFQPTCSEYMTQAIQQYGWYGIILGTRRLLRCHPFAVGGHDPLPHRPAKVKHSSL